MATSFSGGRTERTTNHGQATGIFYHLRLRIECTLFCNLQSRVRTLAVLVIGLYEMLGNPTTPKQRSTKFVKKIVTPSTTNTQQELSWSWKKLDLLCNQCLSPLTLRVRIPHRRGVLDTTLCDKVCQWLAAGFVSIRNPRWSPTQNEF